MTFAMLYKLISKGGYDKEDMLVKLDTFYANGRITQARYMELLEKVLETEAATGTQAAKLTVKNGGFEPFKLNTDGWIDFR